MPELLVEVGCEELPASFVEKAYTDLHENLKGLLEKAGLLRGGSRAMGTPRRLIVSFDDLPERQEDTTKEQRGPAVGSAFDEEGNPTKALLGFCKGAGVQPSDLRNDGQYVWATKAIAGRPTAEILAEIVPQAIRSLTFEKTMRWGSSRMRFARPIRWLVCAFDGQEIPFEIEGVKSGLQSRGHRFYAPESFQAATFEALVQGLRDRHVEPDPVKRRETILATAKQVAAGQPQLTDALVDENTYLTEWPNAVQGEFKPHFLALPEPVLVTAMAKHEKMFPVRDDGGKLTNRFVFVRNSGEDDTVRTGSEWVLNARFNDAKFFFDDDQRHTMEDFLAKTVGIVFQEKLGTVRQRADRFSKLAEEIARLTGADKDEQVLSRTSGLYAKADLSTGLVSELPSLQGIIGGEYARRDGMLEEIAWAISSHYDLGKNSSVKEARSRTAIRVTMADQLDKLAGYLGLGLEPSGSSDPFGLRRAATILIEASWLWDKPIPSYDQLLRFAIGLYKEQGVELDAERAAGALSALFASRYEALLPNVRHDVLAAALLEESAEEVTSPRNVKARIECIRRTAGDTPFVQTMTRPLNIVTAARKKEVEFAEENPLQQVTAENLQSTEGATLLQALKIREEEIFKAAQEERVDDVLSLLRGLQKPITEFFDSTMVMAEEPDVRYARLSLMNAASRQILTAGDFAKIVIEG